MVNDPAIPFREAMREAGIETTDPVVADGKLHRVHVEGDRRGSRNGWYVLHPDGPPAGAFGCWKRGIEETWCATERRDLSPEDRARWRRRIERARRERKEAERRRREKAREKARRLWTDAEVADPDHPYLQAKGVRPHGIHQLGDTLLVPVRGPNGKLRGLQRIQPDGEKRFLSGTKVRGSYHRIGGMPDGVVAITEGYATGATVHEATRHAVAVAFNAGNLQAVAEAIRAKLDGTRIVLAADNDRETDGNPGLTAATKAAKAVDGLVAVPEFEGGEQGTDWNNFAALRGLEAVREAIEAVVESPAEKGRGPTPHLTLIEGGTRGDSPEKVEEAEEEKAADPSQKARLLQLARGVTLFRDDRDRPCAWIEREGHREVWPVDGSTFRSWLAHRFYSETGNAPSASVLADVLTVLRGRARFEGPTHGLENRIARGPDGAIWYDLADEDWRAVLVTPSGWDVTHGPAAPMFRRYGHQRPQVVPIGGGDLRALLSPFLNLADEDAEVLMLVWLVVALVPDVPRAILVLWGPQGSAKSTRTRVSRALLDPSAVPMPRFPRGEAEMAQVLDHHAAPFFDNVSTLSDRVSDTLCRAVTGDGFSKRKLYSDDDDILYAFRRVLVLNGINVPAQRPDLLDRCLLLYLEKIEKKDRREEREFWTAFEKVRPRIFGAMLDTLSRAMALEPDVRLGALPRMADWTRWGYAVAEALGLGGERFLKAYQANRAAADEEALTSHPVGAAVVAFMSDREEWTGEPSALLRELEKVAEAEKIDTGSKLWPGAPNWLARRLNEVEHNLAEAGIRYERQRTGSRLLRLWRTPNREAVGNADGDGAAGTRVETGDPGRRQADGTRRHTDDSENADAMLSGRKFLRDKATVGNDGTDGIPRTSPVGTPSDNREAF